MHVADANPLVAQLTHRPFPEVAEVLRSESGAITAAWDAAVREAMPQMRHLTTDQLRDSTPLILDAIADALASEDPELIRELVRHAPAQGLSRLELNFDVIEVMQEDRLLRSIIVRHIEAALERRMDVAESSALHATIDLMLQRSVIALVEKQKSQLRAAAQRELKFLSYLSHDLNNHLANVTLWLHALGLNLNEAGGYPEAEQSLASAARSIRETLAGTRRMLDHERLRNADEPTANAPVDLHALAKRVIAQFAPEANAKGVTFAVEIPDGASVNSDSSLLSLVLQNLVGNGAKYSTGGTVRIGFDANLNGDARPTLWVSDDGPGISPEAIDYIFEAFKRGNVHGQPGVGLGLAIVSQAAKLLGAELAVESSSAAGSTFRLYLPAPSHGFDNGAERAGL